MGGGWLMMVDINNSYMFTSASMREMYMSGVIQIPLSNTSKGVLCKWNGLIGDDLYYLKTGKLSYGKFSSLEPISEYISSEIGKLMDINVIDTLYSDIDIEHTEIHKEQTIMISYTKNFLNKGEVFYSMLKLESPNDLYNVLCAKYSEYIEDINKMIIFDFVINNTDRHMNNFGFVLDEDTLKIKRFNTLFNNGNSLLNDLSEDDLIELSYSDIDKYSMCKPFKPSHYEQIKLVKHLPNINLNFDREDIEEIVNNFSMDLSKSRVESIVNLISRRVNYVKKLYS